MHDGKQRTLKPMRDEQIKSDVMLVVRKEKLHKAKPQPGLAKVQHEEHDAKSVGGDNEGFRSIVNQNFPTDANKKAKI
jgi:hypothetical protein